MLPAGYPSCFTAGLAQMLLEFGFGIPSSVTDGPRQFRARVTVLPLPRMVIYPGGRNGFIDRFADFTHIGWSHSR
jgi:hypothetical protein